jgi:hypothetical protein
MDKDNEVPMSMYKNVIKEQEHEQTKKDNMKMHPIRGYVRCINMKHERTCTVLYKNMNMNMNMNVNKVHLCVHTCTLTCTIRLYTAILYVRGHEHVC